MPVFVNGARLSPTCRRRRARRLDAAGAARRARRRRPDQMVALLAAASESRAGRRRQPRVLRHQLPLRQAGLGALGLLAAVRAAERHAQASAERVLPIGAAAARRRRAAMPRPCTRAIRREIDRRASRPAATARGFAFSPSPTPTISSATTPPRCSRLIDSAFGRGRRRDAGHQGLRRLVGRLDAARAAAPSARGRADRVPHASSPTNAS